jgi:glycerate kinase
MALGVVWLGLDRFKGNLNATGVAVAARDGITGFPEGTSVHIAPLADGGDGSVAAAIAAGFEPVEVACTGSLGEPTSAIIAARGSEAVIELASVGKGPVVVAQRCQGAGVPCIAVVGRRSAAVTDEDLQAHGIARVHEFIRMSGEVATDPSAACRAGSHPSADRADSS